MEKKVPYLGYFSISFEKITFYTEFWLEKFFSWMKQVKKYTNQHFKSRFVCRMKFFYTDVSKRKQRYFSWSFFLHEISCFVVFFHDWNEWKNQQFNLKSPYRMQFFQMRWKSNQNFSIEFGKKTFSQSWVRWSKTFFIFTD